ncbi:MAG2-interacting protein 2 [Phytophthora citrophthora]|uniref:MAG2-interacting protein 2 n=1 Tax=Phytophthora citrophthora TaxID=4793 RepID=A0AAD9GSQ9_9STRA|nr:MAG2-interacting protein 2 [Phytophthora citrophthora]
MTEPLLLAARELVRGSVSSLPTDFEVLASAASNTHLAVLFRSRTKQNCVRLGVFKADKGFGSTNSELVDLLSESDSSEFPQHHTDNWTLVWSPDLKFLVVSGGIPCAEGEPEAVLWIFSCRTWLVPEAAAGDPLLLRIDPSQYLSAKQWNPVTSIVNVFFSSQSGNKVFVLSEDGIWLSVSVQSAKLALAAMDPSASTDTTGMFSMKVMKKLTEWHAGVTAACYDPESSTLVVSGGVRDPSEDLVEKQVSSLSVWKVAGDQDNKEVGELLDFTMVVNGKKQKFGEHTEEDKEQSNLDLYTAEESGGLLTSVKSTLFAPLKMMVGGDSTETRVMSGFIHHLAVAPNGNFVSMVDNLGRISIRQIDTCADVLKWQTIENVTSNTQDATTKQVVWLTSDVVAVVLSNNSVVYSRFIAQSEDGTGPTSSDSDNESLSSSGSSGQLLPALAKHFRPEMMDNVRTLSLFGNSSPSSDKNGAQFNVFELVMTKDVWAANQLQSLSLEPFIELLVDAKKFEEALVIVALYETRGNAVNGDDIHRRIWIDFRHQAARIHDDPELRGLVFLSTNPRAFLGALDHLRAISDKRWVLSECLKLIADDSSASMKKILDLAWDAWVHLNDGNEVAVELSQDKLDIQRYLYRLETMRLILCEEEDISTTSLAGDQLFDGEAYALFRSASVLAQVEQFAREGRIDALTVLFHRHAWNLLPHWLDVLELIPPSVSPSAYAMLLPAVSTQDYEDGQFCTLRRPDDVEDDNTFATPVPLLPENQLQDLSEEELSAYKEFSNVPREERNAACSEWFSRQILALDTRYGQLPYAYELGELAIKSLSGWSSLEAKKPLEELFLHTERLYKCVYLLHLSSCCLLPLSDWVSLSLQEQALVVIGTDKEVSGDTTPIIDHLDAVFVSQRRSPYSLDEMFSGLAQTMVSKPSLTSLTLAAQLIQRSNPSMSFPNRWIQSNARLIETALDVAYSVNASEVIGDKVPGVDEDVYMQRHLALVEQLWAIFQALPVRKENDPPDIAQLQVAVDELEDLMVTMEVLSKYGVVSSPSGLKYRMLASDIGGGGGISVGPHGLLEQMCDFALPGEFSDDEDGVDGNQWLEVLQDAIKLKEHAFGERLNQEMILDVILKHLLASDRAYIDAAQSLVNHWIAADVEAVDHVLDELLTAIRGKLGSVAGYSEDANANTTHESALGCIGIVKQLLSLPLWDEGDRAAAGAKQYYQDILALETDRAQACELLDLLTYGAVRMSPSQLRSDDEDEEKENTLLDAVCQVFVSNPSNYKASVRAREWLEQHAEGETVEWSEPLAAVMYLAKLLRVDSEKLEIWMKGAYAALYCMDYDVAYELTMQVIDGIPAEIDAASAKRSGDKLTLLHLTSLVLDLVSASSFGSWGKKRKLCCALFSAANASSSDLFGHQVTDLVLSWLEKIEAIQALMIELGLSEKDLEQRRLTGGKATSSTEAVLLNELKVVVDLLHEERNDRQFLLRLLQRGLRLVQVMLSTDTDTENQANNGSVSTFLKQMTQLCVEEAVALTSNLTTVDSGDWQQYLELGFSYLMLWGDLTSDDNTFEVFCTGEVLDSAFNKQSVSDESVQTSEVVVRRLHHFFLLQAAQAKEVSMGIDRETLLARRKRFEKLSSSYEVARNAVNSQSETDGDVEEVMKSEWLVSKQRVEIYMKLAKRCHEQLISQKKSQELEHMSTFFNTELDLERFSVDEEYRNDKIFVLATKKETFHLSRQFATKYGIDEYACVLTYIKHALLSPSDTCKVGRREQLDDAFAIEKVDIMEEALQRPVSFGDFLLKQETAGQPSLYEAIDGTDHVGLLLVLRMTLECSKRLYQEASESVSNQESSLFPLHNASTDRITLLFMCLKKLKDIEDSLGNVEAVDLKLISAASTTAELLTPPRADPESMTANREVAVEAVRPLLTGKTIKLVTKILRKLHRVTPSAMVMVYLNDLLTGIWREHGASNGTGALSAELAVYAYESCVPCLSVLSNEHLMLFHYLFLDGSSDKSPPEPVAHLNVSEEFYGQVLSGLQHFGSLLTPQKRVELVADTLTLFQTKYNSWQTSGSRSNVSSASSTSSSSSTSWDPAQFKKKEQELQYLERELAENVCCMILSEVERNSELDSVVANLRTWFAVDSLQQAANEEAVHNVLSEISQHVSSVNLASLIMELTLRAGGNKASSELAATTITQSYQNSAVQVVQRCLGSGDDAAKQTAPWIERFVWTWVTGSTASTHHVEELGCYLQASCKLHEKSAVYDRVVAMLSQSPSTLLKEIGLSRVRDLQTPINENDAHSASIMGAVRGAVLSQWEQLISIQEEQQKWAEAAVLSHVLATFDSANVDAVNQSFGLHAKAVWAALLSKYKFDESPAAQRIFDVPSRDIVDHFAAVFDELLAFSEICAGETNPKALRFAEMATVALSNLLVCYEDLRSDSEGAAQHSATAWTNEQKYAVQARVQAQFQVGSTITRQVSPPSVEDAKCWSDLFARGVWGTQLLSWYTTYAYVKLSNEEEVTEAVILAHWEANNLDLAVQLLLMCPFDALRAKHADRALSVLRQLPQGSSNWSTAMELALLRFDVAALLHHKLHSSLVAFLLHNSNKKPALWTSSGDFVVCALVKVGEFAAAGRLTCALRHAHPLLWDVENARLLLANYLRSLASSSLQHKSNSFTELQHQVYVQTSRHFADTFQN